MAIVPPNRLEQHVIRQWYKADKALHEPVIQWLQQNPQAEQGIEKFCNRLLQERSNEAVDKAVPFRTMIVPVTVNLQKAAQGFFSKVPPQAKQGVSPEMVLTAIEMKMEDAGYRVENHILEFEIEVPTAEEIEEMREIAIARKKAAEAAAIEAKQQRQMSTQPKATIQVEDDDLDDDLDEESEEDDEDGDPEDDNEVDFEGEDGDSVEPSGLAPGLAPGQIHGNAKGLLRRIEGIEDDKVVWTIVEGPGTGKTGKTSIASFEKWSQEIFESDAIPA